MKKNNLLKLISLLGISSLVGLSISSCTGLVRKVSDDDRTKNSTQPVVDSNSNPGT
ncbi:hypothetical protein [[Mycoplasma] imitans]|uniref:hypothetical protein n=1 Tax=[Mycoplasma] imitans TaxID=29560 RepID=UPI0004B54A46|nr:hypothetical protein [[Mycoplasma] imitans]